MLWLARTSFRGPKPCYSQQCSQQEDLPVDNQVVSIRHKLLLQVEQQVNGILKSILHVCLDSTVEITT